MRADERDAIGAEGGFGLTQPMVSANSEPGVLPRLQIVSAELRLAVVCCWDTIPINAWGNCFFDAIPDRISISRHPD